VATLIPGETVCILVVSPREEMGREVEAALVPIAGHYRLEQLKQVDQVLARARADPPHMALVDVELGGQAAIVLIRQLAAQMPRLATVALVSQATPGSSKQEAMAVGARGFLVRPVQSEELLRVLRQELGQRVLAALSPTSAAGAARARDAAAARRRSLGDETPAHPAGAAAQSPRFPAGPPGSVPEASEGPGSAAGAASTDERSGWPRVRRRTAFAAPLLLVLVAVIALVVTMVVRRTHLPSPGVSQGVGQSRTTPEIALQAITAAATGGLASGAVQAAGRATAVPARAGASRVLPTSSAETTPSPASLRAGAAIDLPARITTAPPTAALPQTEAAPSASTAIATSSATPQPSITALARSTATRTPAATPSLEAAPTSQPVPSSTSSAQPELLPSYAGSLDANEVDQPTPTATPDFIDMIPTLIAPGPNASTSGLVQFRWQPAGALPPGAAYEVVWWNAGENPADARGIAPPIRSSDLSANLSVLIQSGQASENRINWTVLVVQVSPYVRLTQPANSNAWVLQFEPATGGGGGSPPLPPKPR